MGKSKINIEEKATEGSNRKRRVYASGQIVWREAFMGTIKDLNLIICKRERQQETKDAVRIYTDVASGDIGSTLEQYIP